MLVLQTVIRAYDTLSSCHVHPRVNSPVAATRSVIARLDYEFSPTSSFSPLESDAIRAEVQLIRRMTRVQGGAFETLSYARGRRGRYWPSEGRMGCALTVSIRGGPGDTQRREGRNPQWRPTAIITTVSDQRHLCFIFFFLSIFFNQSVLTLYIPANESKRSFKSFHQQESTFPCIYTKPITHSSMNLSKCNAIKVTVNLQCCFCQYVTVQ